DAAHRRRQGGAAPPTALAGGTAAPGDQRPRRFLGDQLPRRARRDARPLSQAQLAGRPVGGGADAADEECARRTGTRAERVSMEIRAARLADADAIAGCVRLAYGKYVARIGREPKP